jgi:DNA-binding NarL/FixJ family response regulator
LNSQNKHTVILLLLANEGIRSYILSLCKKNDYDYIVVVDPEDLIETIKRLGGAIAFMDHEAVNIYGARIYSRINVTCPGCNVILLSDQDHKNLIKEAMELGVYACILAPYEEWEVLTMIRNILTKRKLRKQKKPVKARDS